MPNIQLIPDTALEINQICLSKEGTMAWNSFFKPTSSCENSVTIPGHWVDLFTTRLLTPEDFT
jgi:hypothetical protein